MAGNLIRSRCWVTSNLCPTAQARRLIEQPRFGSAPGPMPSYCAPSAAQPTFAKAQPEIASMLDRCFGWSCADPSARPGGTAPPLEACEPFPDQACGDADQFAAAGGAPGSSPGRHIDPFTAKLVKGGIWGLFAASTATAIVLFAANAAGAGRLVGTYEMNTQPLVNPAYAATALAAISLGVAIPITLHVNRAQSNASSSPPQSSTPATIQCPN